MGRHFTTFPCSASSSFTALGVTIAGGDFTLAGWFRVGLTPATDGIQIYVCGGLVTASWNGITGKLGFVLGGSGGDFDTALTTSVWTHIAFVRSGNTLTAYILGVAEATTFDVTGEFWSSGSQILGSAGPTFVDHDQAHWALWGSALSGGQITSLAGGANPLAVGTPLHYWPLGGVASPEPDNADSRPLTLSGTAASSDDPAVDAPPSTPAPTTPPPTTPAPTTEAPQLGVVRCGRLFKSRSRRMVARAWVVNEEIADEDQALAPLSCTATLFDEDGEVGQCVGETDPMGAHVVRFVIPVVPRLGHLYVLRLRLVREDLSIVSRDFPMGTS